MQSSQAAPTEKQIAEQIQLVGGRLYLVGGYVRDRLCGLAPSDRDYVLTGLDECEFTRLFPKAEKHGLSFPVYRMTIDGTVCEIAFARKDRKERVGHKGFHVILSKETTISEDLERRDLTVNAIAMDVLTGELVDPFGGQDDLRHKKIREVSKHFNEDPIRALRAARFAAQLGFDVCAPTLLRMQECKEELLLEPQERLFNELEKALKTPKPSVFFRVLEAAGILEFSFPFLHRLIGQTQPPQYHPEGDAFEHTMQCVDKAVTLTRRPEVIFAVLVHDIGKGLTPVEQLPKHIYHVPLGLEALSNLGVIVPTDWKSCAKFAIKEHMRMGKIGVARKKVDLIMGIHSSKLGIDGVEVLLACDGETLPPFLANYNNLLKAFQDVRGQDAPENLRGKEIGEWIRRKRIVILKQETATSNEADRLSR